MITQPAEAIDLKFEIGYRLFIDIVNYPPK